MEFPVGSANGVTQCVDITILEDGLFEGDEYLCVGLSVLTPNVESTRPFTDIILEDNA